MECVGSRFLTTLNVVFQSNVKEVVRMVARLLWGTKVGSWALEAYLVRHSLSLSGTGPLGVGQGRRRADSVDWIVSDVGGGGGKG